MSDYNKQAMISHALGVAKRVHDAGWITLNGAAPWGDAAPNMEDIPPIDPMRIIHTYSTYPDNLHIATFKPDPLWNMNIYTAADFLDRRRIKRNNNRARKAEQNARKKAHKT